MRHISPEQGGRCFPRVNELRGLREKYFINDHLDACPVVLMHNRQRGTRQITAQELKTRAPDRTDPEERNTVSRGLGSFISTIWRSFSSLPTPVETYRSCWPWLIDESRTSTRRVEDIECGCCNQNWLIFFDRSKRSIFNSSWSSEAGAGVEHLAEIWSMHIHADCSMLLTMEHIQRKSIVEFKDELNGVLLSHRFEIDQLCVA